MKVQAAIQGDTVRVTGAKRDDLQLAMQLIKEDRAGRAGLVHQPARLSMLRIAPAALLACCRRWPRQPSPDERQPGRQGPAGDRRRAAQWRPAPRCRA